MKKALLFIFVALSCWALVAMAAPWVETIEVTVTDPNGVNTVDHNFRYSVDGGAWSNWAKVTALPYTFDATIDHGSVIQVEGYPCGPEFCGTAVLASYTVPPAHQPYSNIQITIPSPGP